MAKFNVGDVVRVDGEDFDSVIMDVSGEHAMLAGWPNPTFPFSALTLVKRYDPNNADRIQHRVIEREQERKAAIAKAKAEQCEACNGTGRKLKATVG